ncbi:hypothetical protein TRFO_33341 [Tritrichomonas foetus]|uniref:Protein kinase domain-containing protein n=1 Tax=Tritrichomonas foetus TaxID=1144522 RepID=A0A1J4JMY1_9EUKA|nr:hypothetical protein TRFO_33341 [Tritrichomonas foetus]|eukprot:OHT00050.1 hypothetical protein TRFO_33341 [Tritrichomonas foetus]
MLSELYKKYWVEKPIKFEILELIKMNTKVISIHPNSNTAVLYVIFNHTQNKKQKKQHKIFEFIFFPISLIFSILLFFSILFICFQYFSFVFNTSHLFSILLICIRKLIFMKTSRLIEQNVSLIRTTATAHHYTLKTQIGHGGFSALFLAHSEYYDQDFVIKVSLRSFENVSNRSGNHNFQALRNDQHNNRNCNQANNSKDTNMNSLEKENTYCLTPQETKEIEALKGLNHPNIIKIFEYFVDDRFLYMVLENCPYGSLSDYIRRNGAIKPPVLYNCIGQSILALYHCHSHKIAHRDIKPAN